MPFWRKKNDEFEWQSYVRTTVLMRRKERRQKLEDAGAAAVFGVRQAKWKSIAGLKAAAIASKRATVATGRAIAAGAKASWAYGAPRAKQGSQALGRQSVQAARFARAASGTGLRYIGRGLAHVYFTVILPGLYTIANYISTATRPILDRLATPELFGPLLVLAGVACLGAGANLINTGLTPDTLFVTGLAFGLVGLVVAAWPSEHGPLSIVQRLRWPRFARSQPMQRGAGVAVAATALVLVASAAVWQFGDRLPSLPKVSGWSLPDITPDLSVSDLNPFRSEVLKGRARAIDGGHLRVAQQTVRLDSIDALLPNQTCTNSRGRAWRCGARAKSQLQRLVRRTTLTCTVTGQDDDGVKRATCKTKDQDVGAMLVANGYAFADIGVFASYRDQEDKARKEKKGIWNGSAKRPSDYRMARWDKAVQNAPGGCPIKGRVVRRKRLYALPWDRAYDRIRIRERRGEKWFCSEPEAIAAGFKHASQI